MAATTSAFSSGWKRAGSPQSRPTRHSTSATRAAAAVARRSGMAPAGSGARRVQAREGALADVAPAVHALEVHLLDRLVGAGDRRLQVGAERGDAEDPAPHRLHLAVLAGGGGVVDDHVRPVL